MSANLREYCGTLCEWAPEGTSTCSLLKIPHHSIRARFFVLPFASLPARARYSDLQAETSILGNALRGNLGVSKGDAVILVLPQVPEAAISMLSCARVGAMHSVVFAGFSSEAIAERIRDSGARVVITADYGLRGGRSIGLKSLVDGAIDILDESEKPSKVVVLRRTGEEVNMDASRDIWMHELQGRTASPYDDLSSNDGKASTDNESIAPCEPEWMDSNDPLFILYTSGSTGKPKGVKHATAGYLLQTSMTHEHVFDHREGDVYFSTADTGWITGHSYTVYGPLVNGGSTVMYEGLPVHPTPSRLWQIVDKLGVTQIYTAPTALRSLMAEGDDFVTKESSRRSLRVMGTVGEPINREAWKWYFNVVGEGRCALVDTWWQTETGANMMTNLPGVHAMRPGSCVAPFFGVVPELVDDQGEVVRGLVSNNELNLLPFFHSRLA